jgi:GTP-binding protein EngB required for normal cell division
MHQDMVLVERLIGENSSMNILKAANSMYAFPTYYVALNQTMFFRLKRIYILFTAEHGLNACDHEMLSYLSQKLITPRGTQPFTLQAIVTKSDRLPPRALSTCVSFIQKAIWRTAPLCLPVIVTSTSKESPLNVDLVQKNIAEACGLELDI